MKREGVNKARRRLSRREFTKITILAAAAMGTAGITGYGISNAKRLRTLNNYLRMGHCAPTVMKTLLDINGIQDSSLVTYSGALAGGIAGSGMECGVLTAPLMYMGFRNYGSSICSTSVKEVSHCLTVPVALFQPELWPFLQLLQKSRRVT